MGAEARRIGIVVNPSAGGGLAREAVPAVLAQLRGAGHEVTDLSGPSAGAALARARYAVCEGRIDLLAVVGGDGMAHLGVNACAGTDVPLGIIPLGTGNDIATGLGIPAGDPVATAAMLDRGRTRVIDAGRHTGDLDRPWFAGVLYAGFDSVVNARANRMTWPRGSMRYNLAVLRELPTFKPIPYVVDIDGHRIETEAMLVIVANGASYGGGMKVTPQARLDDGVLDVMILHRLGRAEFLRVFPTVFSGSHVDHRAVQMLRGRRVSLTAAGVTAFADGEPFASVPLTCEVVPGALRVIVP